MKLITHILALALALTSAAFAKDEKEIAFAKCPAAVQAALTREAQAAAGTVGKVEHEVKDGAELYDAKITKPDGSKLTVKLSPDGRVLERKEKKAK